MTGFGDAAYAVLNSNAMTMHANVFMVLVEEIIGAKFPAVTMQYMSALREFIERHPRIVVLTGAGVSTSAGIPDYRDEQGEWKRARPVEFRPFMTSASVRRKYWSRSTVGWPFIARAQPSTAHRALARLETLGVVQLLVTQNVDGLHEAAGSRNVIDLHGRLDVVPDCPRCGGILKPDVVFFGEPVPRERVARAFEGISNSDALLIVGSSLMVYSGFRFAEAAAAAGKPIAAVNLGRTRADHLFTLKVSAPSDETLNNIVGYYDRHAKPAR